MDKENLKKAGLKITGPRVLILKILEGQTSHLSAEEIHQALIQKGEEIGLATVYRVLTQFQSAGLIIRHNFEEGRSVFELDDGKHHDHIVCVKCGIVEEFVDPIIEQQQIKVAKALNFKMTDHALTLYGVCRNCDA